MRITAAQFDIAVLWLESNEGEGAERQACQRVAEWLKAEVNRRCLRGIARKAGVPVSVARRSLAEIGGG